MTLILFSILLVIQQAFDLVLTRKILSLGGRELNPIMRNPELWIPVKLFVTVICIVLSIFTSWYALIFPNILMFIVCLWNLNIYRRLP